MRNSDKTQENLVARFRNRPKPEERGTKFSGDVCCRILKSFLEAEIRPQFRVSDPNAYIWDCPTEFDLLVIRRDARLKRYTNAFRPEAVLCAVEVKAAGTGFGSQEDFKKDLHKLREGFKRAKKRFPGLGLLYFTFEESNPKRPDSFRYLTETRKALRPFPVFCMADRRTGELLPGQWRAFVRCVRKSCNRRQGR